MGDVLAHHIDVDTADLANYDAHHHVPHIAVHGPWPTAFDDEAANQPQAESLQALTQYRPEHRRTIDGRLCAAAGVFNRQVFTGCTDGPSPAGNSGRPWCYVEPQLLNQTPGLPNFGFCAPRINYNAMSKAL